MKTRNTYASLTALLFVLFTLHSCVPQRKYADLEARQRTAETENESLRRNKEQMEAQLKELNTTVATQEKQIASLNNDTASIGKQYRQLRIQYDKINELNDILSKKSNELLGQATGENKKLLDELNRAQEALQKKEDALKSLEKNLNEKQAAIDQANLALGEKQKRVEEMENLLADQKRASEALRNKVANALLSFKDKGLTVSEKDGKVYVSMEAKLLFATGSTAVDPNGRKAIVDLAKAIENEVDMEIIVEGHTDTDRLASTTYPKDNWDLSVLRATEVVKIMMANSKVKPTILSASGRGEFYPVDPNNKAKNRRIEIILAPKLDELYKLIEGN